MGKQGARRRAEAYVDRIAVWPGQMTTYGLGELEIRRLRKDAEVRLGGRFDIRAFHDAVLGNGSVTLLMLRDPTVDGAARYALPFDPRHFEWRACAVH